MPVVAPKLHRRWMLPKTGFRARDEKNGSTEKRRFPLQQKMERYSMEKRQKRNKPHLARLPQEPGERFQNRKKRIYKTSSQEPPPGHAMPEELELVAGHRAQPLWEPGLSCAGGGDAAAALTPGDEGRGEDGARPGGRG